jgi:hypothetical protein
MQLARRFRMLGALLVAGLAVAVVGCGSGAPPGPTAETKAADQARAEDMRNFHKQFNPMFKKQGGSRSQAVPGAKAAPTKGP